MATFDESENDVRFLYSACCICYILNDWAPIDKERAVSFLRNCLVRKILFSLFDTFSKIFNLVLFIILIKKTYEGAFGQNQESEAHGMYAESIFLFRVFLNHL